jgi:hypothetical protein
MGATALFLILVSPSVARRLSSLTCPVQKGASCGAPPSAVSDRRGDRCAVMRGIHSDYNGD